MKANAYISYEKESPDMALAYLMDLTDIDAARKGTWIYNGSKAEDGFFEEAIQEYCFSFYQIGSVQAREAFHTLSRKMNGLYPENLTFINNIGTYHLVVKEDYKTALKYYKKVLKKNPEDMVALQNAVLAARKSGNTKLEQKYRQTLTTLTVSAK